MSRTQIFQVTTPTALDLSGVANDLARSLNRSVVRRTCGLDDSLVTTVAAEDATLLLEVDDTTPAFNDVITFSFTLVPGGTGAFTLHSSIDGDFAATPADETGESAVAWGALAVGAHTITATFYGDGSVGTTVSNSITVTVS